MSYRNPGYVTAYLKTGKFPEIHEAISTMILNIFPLGAKMLDVGCSTGLLTMRMRVLGFDCIGIDHDETALAMANDLMLGTFHQFQVARHTFPQFYDFLSNHNIDTVVARRVLPELFGDNPEAGKLFAKLLYQVGVKRIFLEGRHPHPNPVNPLADVVDEIELLKQYFRAVVIAKNVAYLTVRNQLHEKNIDTFPSRPAYELGTGGQI